MKDKKRSWDTIKEIDGKFICTSCGKNLSAMADGKKIPSVCECQFMEDAKIVSGDIVYNILADSVITIDDEDDLIYVNKAYFKLEDKPVPEPFIQLDAFKKAVVTLGDNTREFDFLQLIELTDLIKDHLKTAANMTTYLNYYHNFLEKMDERLDNQETLFEQEESDEYKVGENYAMFTNSGTETGMADNHTAGRLIEKAYIKKFKKHTLIFDSESSYCHVYTKDRAEAKRFLEFVYRNYIRQVLEPWYEGFKEFSELVENATNEQKGKIVHLIY